jgi:hypothetical protein
MANTSGRLQACSPRGPSYSGRLIARAVELYRDGVKPGYMRWHELQGTLEKEFPDEIKQSGQDKPSPDTVMEWVKKYPDAPERLIRLRVEPAEPHPSTRQAGVPYFVRPARPPGVMVGTGAADLPHRELFAWLTAFMVMLIMAHCARSLSAA